MAKARKSDKSKKPREVNDEQVSPGRETTEQEVREIERFCKAHTHEDRIRVAVEFAGFEPTDQQKGLSPREIARNLFPEYEREQGTPKNEKLTHVGYHVRGLRDAGVIRQVEEVPVRGAMEHLYVMHDWAKEALRMLREQQLS